MKLLHTSDIHLASPLTSKLPSSKVTSRRRELFSSFLRLTERAKMTGASGIIIAGDLFDSERIRKSELDSLFSVILSSPEISFFYLAGNHEKDAVTRSGLKADNLFIFGEGWTSFSFGDVIIHGRTETSADMFDTIPTDKSRFNIAVLHGELKQRSAEGGVIGLGDAAGRGIDYLALGHYHTYSERAIDKRGVAVYSGSPEGRGFDELGDMGYSEITVSGGEVTHRFVSLAKRKIHEIPVDITGAMTTPDIERRIAAAVSEIPTDDLVRSLFVGVRELELRCDKEYLKERFSNRFYYFEIKDKSGLTVRAEDYRYDKSLRGEFIRMVLSDESLSDSEREKIIHCGLSALSGEAFDIGDI